MIAHNVDASKKNFVATGTLVFDFGVFVGGLFRFVTGCEETVLRLLDYSHIAGFWSYHNSEREFADRYVAAMSTQRGAKLAEVLGAVWYNGVSEGPGMLPYLGNLG